MIDFSLIELDYLYFDRETPFHVDVIIKSKPYCILFKLFVVIQDNY